MNKSYHPTLRVPSRRVSIEEDLENRVLDFDSPAALEAAELAAQRQRAGRPVDFRDTQIAGIALARRAALATRNTRHFADLAVPVVDPWESSGTLVGRA